MAGEKAVHIGSYGFKYFGFWMGDTGLTIALVLLMVRSRADVCRQLGRLSLVSGLFKINKPIAYGFPIVFNPIM